MSKQYTFINARPANAQSAIALGVQIINKNTREEKHLDIILETGSLSELLTAIKQHVGLDWGIYESWVIDRTESPAIAA